MDTLRLGRKCEETCHARTQYQILDVRSRLYSVEVIDLLQRQQQLLQDLDCLKCLEDP